MMTGPGGETAATGGPGGLRASHADRERAIEAIKAAFVQGRLTTGELDRLVGQALKARTYAELDAVTAGIPARSGPPRRPQPARARRPEKKVVSPAVCVIMTTTLAAGIWAGVVAGGAAAIIVAMFMLNLAALATRT